MTKTVFITGASSGIGKATARYFSDHGWHVAATMRSPDKDQAVKNFSNTRVYPLDVTNPQSIKSALTQAQKDFKTIDIVVNNAGFGVDGVFEAMSDDTIQKQFDTNVFGLMRVTRAFITYFRTQKIPGTIIQVASMGGRLAFPLYSIYHGTKWAVEGFSESLQYELRPFGIRIKLIEPGSIKTAFYTSSREKIRPKDTHEYDAFITQSEKVSLKSGKEGVDPLVVAKTIFKAANDSSWQMRYPVGNPAPLLLALRKLLPDSLWFWIVRRSYQID